MSAAASAPRPFRRAAPLRQSPWHAASATPRPVRPGLRRRRSHFAFQPRNCFAQRLRLLLLLVECGSEAVHAAPLALGFLRRGPWPAPCKCCRLDAMGLAPLAKFLLAGAIMASRVSSGRSGEADSSCAWIPPAGPKCSARSGKLRQGIHVRVICASKEDRSARSTLRLFGSSCLSAAITSDETGNGQDTPGLGGDVGDVRCQPVDLRRGRPSRPGIALRPQFACRIVECDALAWRCRSSAAELTPWRAAAPSAPGAPSPVPPLPHRAPRAAATW